MQIAQATRLCLESHKTVRRGNFRTKVRGTQRRNGIIEFRPLRNMWAFSYPTVVVVWSPAPLTRSASLSSEGERSVRQINVWPCCADNAALDAPMQIHRQG